MRNARSAHGNARNARNALARTHSPLKDSMNQGETGGTGIGFAGAKLNA